MREGIALFEFWERAYKNQWITKEQLKQAVVKGLISEEEYKKITKEDYVA